jgi:hypothetical protein
MEWLKNQVIAALSGDQKVYKQLLIALAGVVAVASLVLVAVSFRLVLMKQLTK